MPACPFSREKTGQKEPRSRIAPGDARVFYTEYPYRYTEHLRKSGAFVLVNIRISIPDASGRAGAFISVNIRINIPNASGGAMAGAFILVNIRTGILNAPGGFRA